VTNLADTIFTEFPKKRVLIVGDLVADQFLEGSISRVSREAPVFILKHEDTETLPGAAANAAANVASLGGQAILLGVVGDDAHGSLLLSDLKERGVDTGGTITSAEIATTTKVRVLAGHHYAPRQQVIRIDYENTRSLSEKIRESLLRHFRDPAQTADAMIMSDYNGGVVFSDVFELARSIAKDRKIPLIVDSRFRLTEFTGATTATPNREEVQNILGEQFSVDDFDSLRERSGYKALLVTNGNEGMVLVEDGKPPLVLDAIGSKEPVDVTGAGDTVIATYALGLASGLGFAEAATIANHAGGIVVMKKRTATITAEELVSSLRKEAPARRGQNAT
jgi:rfaE bifunctional protein kinase chain/domain